MYNAGDEADTTGEHYLATKNLRAASLTTLASHNVVLLMPVELWTVTEVSVAIICACLPTLGPLVSRFGPAALHLLSPRRKGKSSGYTSSSSGRTPDGSAALDGSQRADSSESSKNARRQHRFSATRSHNFQRLEGDSSFYTSTFTSTNRDHKDGGYYPKVTPAGYAAEQDVEISSGGRAGGGGSGGGGVHGKRAVSRVGTRETRLVEDEENTGGGGGGGDEIPLQGIHVEHHMTWAETRSGRS